MPAAWRGRWPTTWRKRPTSCNGLARLADPSRRARAARSLHLLLLFPGPSGRHPERRRREGSAFSTPLDTALPRRYLSPTPAPRIECHESSYGSSYRARFVVMTMTPFAPREPYALVAP